MMGNSDKIGTNIKQAKFLLELNELVGIPTETVYGLAANALNEEAVIKIYRAKDRPSFNPLIIHLPCIAAIETYAILDPISEKLAHAFMPGPLTLLLNKKDIIPDLVTASSKKVAVRIPQHPLTLKLLHLLNFPLAAPSANKSGYVSATTAKHVLDGLGMDIAYVLDGGNCEVGLESTIVEVVDDAVIMHRIGAISAEAIELVSQLKVIDPAISEAPVTPGQMKSHYATNVPLYIGNIEAMIQEHQNKNIATISFNKSYDGIINGHQYVLSPKGDINEAAQHLFAVMRLIDDFHFDIILTERFPNEGLGRAINERLERAQAIHK